jgi:hypothetical protein
MRVGEDRVKKARVKPLKRQLDRLEMDDGETVMAFSQKLTTLVAEIRSLGEQITDEMVIDRFFCAWQIRRRGEHDRAVGRSIHDVGL